MALKPPWKKGQSGNPKGRPPAGQSIAEYIRGLAGADGRVYVDQLHALATLAHNNPMIRVKALEVLMKRGWGDYPQSIDLSASQGLPVRVIHEYHDAA